MAAEPNLKRNEVFDSFFGFGVSLLDLVDKKMYRVNETGLRVGIGDDTRHFEIN